MAEGTESNVLDERKLKLEQSKLAQDRDKAAYDQNFLQFRNLNDHLHRLPTLSTTLTGGLWFAAGVQKDLPPEIRFALLYLAGWFSLMLILVMFRLRDVMACYLEKIGQFHPPFFASGEPRSPQLPGLLAGYSMVRLFAAMSGIAGVLSWIGAFTFFWPAGWPYRGFGIVGTLVVIVLLLLWVMMRRKDSEQNVTI